MRSSTVTDNSAPETFGSGIAFQKSQLTTASVQIGSTIISGNDHSDIDFTGIGSNQLLSLGYNLIGAGNITSSFNQAGDQVGILNPQLAALADNGGPTKTHALLAGSPALDAGDPAAVAGVGTTTIYDQRGKPMSRVAGGRIDIGAYESQPIPAAFMGDFNADGFVGSADYVVWRMMLGQSVSPNTSADGSGDGVVGPEDYALWRSHFGSTVPQPASGMAAAIALTSNSEEASRITPIQVAASPHVSAPLGSATLSGHKKPTLTSNTNLNPLAGQIPWRDKAFSGWQGRDDKQWTNSILLDSTSPRTQDTATCDLGHAIDFVLDNWTGESAS